MRKALRYLIPALALLGPSASSAGSSAETASEILGRHGESHAFPFRFRGFSRREDGKSSLSLDKPSGGR